MPQAPFSTRSSGILLHPTSLPGPFALGDIGPAARAFVEFLHAARQTWWQMLPIHPVGGGNSPYDSSSAFAGSELLVSLEDLARDGLLTTGELDELPRHNDLTQADFDIARKLRADVLPLAFSRFETNRSAELARAYQGFVDENSSWLWDWCLFRALKARFYGAPWPEWPLPLRDREPSALAAAHGEEAARVAFEAFLQFCFHHQWDRLRTYAAERSVRLMGDVPMFVAHDSVDVWANRHSFFLDGDGQRTVQAGVPPDYFSEDGQLWGNPLYRWDVMQADGYGWWLDRLRRELRRFDAVRLDHFVAFHRYWEVPMGQTTARAGRYVEVPGRDFFERARSVLGGLPLLAEDLGIVTPAVDQLRDGLGLPGMRILQFAFSPGAEAYLPHRHPAHAVVYTGTHDNNTTRGWYELLLSQAAEAGSADQRAQRLAEAARIELDRVRAYTGVSHPDEVTGALLRALLTSPAHTAIFPLQDALDQGAASRMNIPGVATGNWTYRVEPGALTPELADRLAALTTVTERSPR